MSSLVVGCPKYNFCRFSFLVLFAPHRRRVTRIGASKAATSHSSSKCDTTILKQLLSSSHAGTRGYYALNLVPPSFSNHSRCACVFFCFSKIAIGYSYFQRDTSTRRKAVGLLTSTALITGVFIVILKCMLKAPR